MNFETLICDVCRRRQSLERTGDNYKALNVLEISEFTYPADKCVNYVKLDACRECKEAIAKACSDAHEAQFKKHKHDDGWEIQKAG